jgi:hypothetical protein
VPAALRGQVPARHADAVAAEPDAQLTTRLTLASQHLHREFPSVPARVIDEHFSTVVTELLASARLFEFVPVLAGRYTRERIEAGVAMPARAAA